MGTTENNFLNLAIGIFYCGFIKKEIIHNSPLLKWSRLGEI